MNMRIQRWNLRLQAYDFELVHKAGKNNLADPLSRLVDPQVTQPTPDKGESRLCYVVNASVPNSIKLDTIRRETENDEEIKQVLFGLRTNLWEKVPVAFRAVKNELGEWNGILLRGDRIVVPASLRQKVCELAHEGHPGIVNMKARMRTKVWWPSMYKNAEETVKTCNSCQLVAQYNPPEPIRRRVLPEAPWQQVAFDILGPLPSKDYILVVIDYYSRFYEVKILKQIGAEAILCSLEEIFARYGLPEILTCDNAPQHHATELKSYCEENNIRLFYSTPLWPQSNGEVERQNRSILKILKIAQLEKRDWRRELLKFLSMQRNTPHATTGVAPAELLFRF